MTTPGSVNFRALLKGVAPYLSRIEKRICNPRVGSSSLPGVATLRSNHEAWTASFITTSDIECVFLEASIQFQIVASAKSSTKSTLRNLAGVS